MWKCLVSFISPSLYLEEGAADTLEQEAGFRNRYGRFGEKYLLLQPIA
jgi:hypothetical protein